MNLLLMYFLSSSDVSRSTSCLIIWGVLAAVLAFNPAVIPRKEQLGRRHDGGLMVKSYPFTRSEWQHAMLARLPVRALVESRVSHHSVTTTMVHFEGLWPKILLWSARSARLASCVA